MLSQLLGRYKWKRSIEEDEEEWLYVLNWEEAERRQEATAPRQQVRVLCFTS